MSISKKKAAPESERAERFVLMLRHGIAEDATAEKKDEDRGLTAEGHARMKEIVRGIELVLPKAEAIYSSPLLRAVQTSLWVSKAYRSRVEVKTVDALLPGAATKSFRALLDSIGERRVVLVGHEPNLTDNMRALVGIKKADAMELKKGGCYGIRIDPAGTAMLEWLMPPRILRKLGRR